MNVKGEPTVNGSKCIMERMSPWPRTVTKEHDQGFIKAEGSGESSLPFVSLLNLDVIVPPSNVHL